MAFAPGLTPFALYDGDAAFAADADHLVKWIAAALGGGPQGLSGTLAQQDETHVQIELASTDIYAQFEAATAEYGATINAFQAKSTLASFLGSATGSLTGGQDRFPQNSLEWARRQAQPYGEEFGVGGNRPFYSGSIELTAGQQSYDLNALLGVTGSDGKPLGVIVRKLFHFSPFASMRFFGTTSAINYLNGEFNFQTFTPESVFYMLPVWEDVLRGAQFKESNTVRRSHYSFEMHGNTNTLVLFPVPDANNTLFLTYNLADPLFPLDPTDSSTYGVSNVSNLPFGTIPYSGINSIGRQWIWKMTLALCKEVLGLIRRKMLTVPIPGGDLSLDGASLVTDGRAEMDQLRSQLHELLDSLTYDKLAAKELAQAQASMQLLSLIPLRIFIG